MLKLFRYIGFLLLCLSPSAQSSIAQSCAVQSTTRNTALFPGQRYNTATATGAKREVLSNESGLYEAAGLLPGEYQLQ